jgi:integrase
MATIKKYRGAWSVRWTDRRGQHRRRCPDKETAKELVREIERAHSLGREWEPAASREATRIGEALTAYLGHVARVSQSAHTIRRTGESLEYARALWGEDMPLRALTADHLERLWTWLRDAETSRRFKNGGHAGQRSLDTVAKHLTTLHTFWDWAETKYGDECPRPRRIVLPRSTPELPRAPTWAECDRMIGELSVEWQRRAAVLARFTGARSHEIVSLDWRDVRLDEGAIHWRHAITKGGYGGRVVPIPPPLLEELAGWGKRDGLVFGGTALSEAHMRDDFSRAWRRALVPEDRWFRQPTHAFRKALETELRARGVPHEILNVYVGHRGQTVADRFYADPRWAWGGMVEAVAKIEPINWAPRALEVM